MSNLTQQILVICGDEDTDNGKGSELQSLIPQSRFAEVPGDHNNTRYSAAFAAAVLRFFTGH